MDTLAYRSDQNPTLHSTTRTDKPLRILGISPEGGKNLTVTTGYGSIVSFFFGGLAQRHKITLRSTRPEGMTYYVNLLRSLIVQRSGWRRYSAINPWIYQTRSRLAHQLVKQMQDEIDLVIQWSTLCSPFVGRPLKSYALYIDYTTKLHDAHHYSTYRSSFYRDEKEHEAYYRLESESYRRASRVFTYNELVRRSVIEDYGADPEKVIKVGTGVCFDPLDPTIEKRYDSRQIVFIGKDRAFLRKGVPNLLTGFAMVREVIPDAQLLLIGLAPERIPPQSGVVNLGFIHDRQRLRQILQEAAMFAMTPLIDPSPGVIREAMAMKLPVVASNVDGIPEMVIDGQTGYLVPPEEPKQLAETIINLLQDENKMRNMGERGYARVLEHFTWDRVLSKVEPHLYAMLENGKDV